MGSVLTVWILATSFWPNGGAVVIPMASKDACIKAFILPEDRCIDRISGQVIIASEQWKIDRKKKRED